MKLFIRQLHFELLKLFARKRTYVGFGAFLLVEWITLLLLQIPGEKGMFARGARSHGLDVHHYYSGLTLGYAMVTSTVFLLGSLYLALVSGDIVAKEVEDGTLRMVLSRPVSRWRILLLKYISCVIYTWTLAVFIVVSSLLFAIAYKGLGGLLIISFRDHSFIALEQNRALLRYAFATGLLGLVFPTLATLGFMFSCFNLKPATATILTLSLYIIDSVLQNGPFFPDLHPYMLTYHLGVWTQAFQPMIPWDRIRHSLLYLGCADTLFVAAGAWYFLRRDFKS